ncbi:hypothetical protein A3C20_03160 [Candidatus Kaiserbacteria bacterium RIFCSPHIGHO2_02_FULL_55_25]|uniref:Uncharacterized protein n=1 Tax=Candidatus Kaiserbacteria bacterium RIFCSPHIGHO2_02_FULL_55_25 TaxID=1798498 RepID=A0A1F6E6D7_9BACT|nr:MAG: hypothetical protein A3C20_03160 [Candidatus Kaiserbacteria bacterium RIFCSPHIGHO2_02_FULL_55_25]OGG77030.1 MAG: hypothetical protein A3F56_01045 [Candidatus Kaiserbacteria bacterium RIFCSPHIGHO2_12_FULL_55_13]OGG83898.1 MAG: hypothetical protein A3A42_00165 [Candidatus Kaiserbacteria bacterium RIFCSPLOWO2_01_FULL_55_25]
MRRGSRGVTLIDTLVATSLMVLIFMGIFGAFQLSVDVVTNNKARAGAVALADERMEYLRSLPYSSLGTVGGIPAGSLAQTESVSLNGVNYTRRTLVVYADDPKDGAGGSDTTGIADYKAVKVNVSWSSRTGQRDLYLVSRFEPLSGLESAVSGGTLVINVVNANSQPVSSAQVTVTNTSVSPAVNLTTYTNTSGVVTLVGTPAATNYAVVATKGGYSTAQTYPSTPSNPNPSPANLTVSNNQTTSATFAIDLLSSMTVSTYSLSTGTWQDSFGDNSKIGEGTDYMEAAGNQARLEGNQPWTRPGELRSIPITPVALSRWGIFSWNDTRPSQTTITYHVYYPSGGSLALVPDSVLAGNSTGYATETQTSVDLSAISAALYPTLVLGAHLVAQDPNAPSPSIQDWSLTYESGQGISIPFTLQGAKVIGNGPPLVYKYSQVITTNQSGTASLSNMEWDTYTMSVNSSTGYDIASSCTPQPIVLAPNSTAATLLYLSPHTSNSLLVDVKNTSGAYLPGALVRLTKGGSYDRTIYADACGQAFFSSLTNGSYSISVSASGYQTYTSSGVNVSGASRLSAILN